MHNLEWNLLKTYVEWDDSSYPTMLDVSGLNSIKNRTAVFLQLSNILKSYNSSWHDVMHIIYKRPDSENLDIAGMFAFLPIKERNRPLFYEIEG